MQTVSRSLPKVYIVVPCYCEEQTLPITVPTLLSTLHQMANEGIADMSGSRLLLVDDGSTDQTWNLILTLSEAHAEVEGVRLSHNRGHQNALLCGLSEALEQGCNCAISIDADGQDDAEAMRTMVQAYLEGSDVVYGVRSDRSSDSRFKRVTAQLFYRTMQLLDVETVYNHADYRLLSARALEALIAMPEANVYLRGMVPLIGFPHTTVHYDRERRIAGKSHYSLSKMLSLASDGLTSFSMKPLRTITTTGAVMTLGGAMAVPLRLCRHKPALIPVAVLLTGMQMTSVGVVGEYVGKAYLETKRRPRWIVQDRTFSTDERTRKDMSI